MKKIKLFDYQQRMLEDIINVLTTASTSTFYNENGKKEKVGSSVMVQMPTGTGKTYVMAAVVKWFLDNHDTGEVWIVAHRRELVEQMQQTLERLDTKIAHYGSCVSFENALREGEQNSPILVLGQS